ncbi:MAG: hypothetical protein IPQ06_11835 [Chitinophagaceae bacterium]|nr:hypothetical protein [Chitinophagaceae bacterium]
MKQLLPGLISIFHYYFLSTGCKTSGYSHALKDEESDIVIKEKPDAISCASIKRQEIPSLNDRATASRGLFGPLVGWGRVALATNAVKKMIAKDRPGMLPIIHLP